MAYAFLQSGVPVEIIPGFPFTDSQGIQRPGNWIDNASASERTAANVQSVVEPPNPPEGKLNVPGKLSLVSGKITREYTLVPVPVPGMPTLAYRQFGRGLYADGIITFEEALKFVGPGDLPPQMLAILNQIPDKDTRENAILDATGAIDYEFTNPLVEYVRQSLMSQDPKWTPEYLRMRWVAWSKL